MSKGQEYKSKQWVGSQLTTEEGRGGPGRQWREKQPPMGALIEGGEEGGREGPFLSLIHQAHLQNCPSCCLPVSKEKNDRLINRLRFTTFSQGWETQP